MFFNSRLLNPKTNNETMKLIVPKIVIKDPDAKAIPFGIMLINDAKIVSPNNPPQPKLWGQLDDAGTPEAKIDDKATNIGKNTTLLKKEFAFKRNVSRIAQINMKMDKIHEPKPIVTIIGAAILEVKI